MLMKDLINNVMNDNKLSELINGVNMNKNNNEYENLKKEVDETKTELDNYVLNNHLNNVNSNNVMENIDNNNTVNLAFKSYINSVLNNQELMNVYNNMENDDKYKELKNKYNELNLKLLSFQMKDENFKNNMKGLFDHIIPLFTNALTHRDKENITEETLDDNLDDLIDKPIDLPD